MSDVHDLIEAFPELCDLTPPMMRALREWAGDECGRCRGRGIAIYPTEGWERSQWETCHACGGSGRQPRHRRSALEVEQRIADLARANNATASATLEHGDVWVVSLAGAYGRRRFHGLSFDEALSAAEEAPDGW